MGAEFICGVLETEKGAQPDFEAARRHLQAMSVEQLCQAFIEASGLSPTDFEAEHIYSSDAEMAVDARSEFGDSIALVERAWNRELRVWARFDGAKTTMLVTGEHSWGDPCEGIEVMSRFVESGCAKAAGFLM